MAANVTVVASALTDPKFAKLAKRVGLADGDHARGKLEHVWSYCTDRQVHYLTAEDFDLIAGVDGIAQAACLPEVGLAEETSRGIRVCGLRGKIEWLKKLRDNAGKGGRKKAANRLAKGRQKEGVEASNSLPEPFPLTLTLTPSLTPSPVPTKRARGREELPPAAAVLDLELVSVIPATRATDPKPPTGDHAAFIADFDALFAEHNGGARPTWGGKQGKAVKAMLAAHGLPECLRRSANMFRAPPEWPPKPHDLDALAKHFDLFAQPFKRTGGHFRVTGDEEYAGGEVEI